MIAEHDDEPVKGLPGFLPKDEEILWQGTPDWKRLAVNALHVRKVAIYFALLAVFGAVSGSWTGVLATVGVGTAGIAILALIAWGTARSTVYTLTNRRVVLRIGIALPKCINLPLSLIKSADLSLNADGTGDIPLTLNAEQRLGYIQLWPHARAWKLREPQPMLRAVPDAQKVATLLARACGARLEVVPQQGFEQAIAA
jgi:Bacterial PH domain